MLKTSSKAMYQLSVYWV